LGKSSCNPSPYVSVAVYENLNHVKMTLQRM
jgi:hypothetical protein